jgi:hypothetical protein
MGTTISSFYCVGSLLARSVANFLIPDNFLRSLRFEEFYAHKGSEVAGFCANNYLTSVLQNLLQKSNAQMQPWL